MCLDKSETVGAFAHVMCGSWDVFMASMSPVYKWPSKGFDPSARAYAIQWKDDAYAAECEMASVEYIIVFREENRIPDSAPAARFGPFDGYYYIIGQAALPVLDSASEALAFINRYRARHVQRPLDPVAAGWTDDDLRIEARRLGWRPNNG